MRDWSRCRVFDVSTSGAGLEFPGAGGAGVGDLVIVDLQLVRSTTTRITLTGEVRHVTPVATGVRVGVRFVDVGDLEHLLLVRLVARQKHERRRLGVVTPLSPS
jgi:hypothetical protein